MNMNIDLPPDILTYTLLMLALLAVYHNMIIIPMMKKIQATKQQHHETNEHFTVDSPRYLRQPTTRRMCKRVPTYSERPYLRVNKKREGRVYHKSLGNDKYKKSNRVPLQMKKKVNYAMNVNPNNIDNRLNSCKSTVNSLEDKRTYLPKYNAYEHIEQDPEAYSAMDSYRASQQEHLPDKNNCSDHSHSEPSPDYYYVDDDDNDSDSDNDHYE